jgi:hypothetical protein
MAQALTAGGILVAIAGVLLAAFPDKASDPRPGWVIPVVIGCVAVAAAVVLAQFWHGMAGSRSRIRRRAQGLWRKRWMPGGIWEARMQKLHGEKAIITKGSWTWLGLDKNKSQWHWQCPRCLGDNPYNESECYGCGAVLEYERGRVRWPGPNSRFDEHGRTDLEPGQ